MLYSISFRSKQAICLISKIRAYFVSYKKYSNTFRNPYLLVLDPITKDAPKCDEVNCRPFSDN